LTYYIYFPSGVYLPDFLLGFPFYHLGYRNANSLKTHSNIVYNVFSFPFFLSPLFLLTRNNFDFENKNRHEEFHITKYMGAYLPVVQKLPDGIFW